MLPDVFLKKMRFEYGRKVFFLPDKARQQKPMQRKYKIIA
jgi:hypothetical protein